MKVPVSWLREFVSLPSSGRQVADLLVSVGFEVEGLETVGNVRGTLVVGRVSAIEELEGFKKPIRFCQVEVGQAHGHRDTPGVRGIVCGARNFAVGDLVIVALPGTTLPGDFTIATRETYGRVSDGMICSQRELGLGDDHDGILVVSPESAAPGDDAFPILGLGDEVLDVAVTPDRGYALSLRGIAREVAIAQGQVFQDPAAGLPHLPEANGSAVPTASDDYAGCDLIMLRTLEGFDPLAPTPGFIRSRLAAVGVRSISLAVDVTNYVMFELGQPLHAFDADRVLGTVRCRPARAGETLQTIDHIERTLSPDDLVIADDVRVLSLAGVMGGADSEITDATTRIVIEAAHFDSARTARSSRRHRLSSEASRRFERGVDRMLAPVASARAAQLLIEHGGATYAGTAAVESAPDPTSLAFDPALPGRVAGHSYELAIVSSTLRALGCRVADESVPWSVRVPSWRPDLRAPIDLVEEVLRIDGYDRIPSRLPVAPTGVGLTTQQRLTRRIGLYLAGRGLVEVHNYPFIGAADFDALQVPSDGTRRHALRLANPLREEQPLLRTTLLPGLLGTLGRNVSRGFTEVSLFEVAPVVLPRPDQPSHGHTDPPRPTVTGRPSAADVAALEALLPQQPLYVAAVSSASTWHEAVETVLSLAAELGVDATVQPAAVDPWHPGRCAQVLIDGVVVATAGEVSPQVLERWGLPLRTVAFEADASAMIAAARLVPAAPTIGTFPIAKEDVALVVDREVPAAAVRDALRAAAGELLEDVRLFDEYHGAQVPQGKKSLAFNLRFRAADRTLSSDEVAAARQAAVSAVATLFGATLRS